MIKNQIAVTQNMISVTREHDFGDPETDPGDPKHDSVLQNLGNRIRDPWMRCPNRCISASQATPRFLRDSLQLAALRGWRTMMGVPG